jgi:hypothetical protein
MAPFPVSDNPAGKLPDIRLHVYGGVPPLPLSIAEYAAPTMPSGRLVVVIESAAGAIVIDNCFVALCDALSVTRTMNAAVPDAVGVPLIAPLPLSDNPAGKLPVVTLHVYGGVPPLPLSIAEYAAPAMPSGKLVVVTESVAGAIVIDNCFVAVCDAPSVTRTVNVAFPAAVGVPVMTPFPFSDNPAGKLPDIRLHVYGGVPPLAVRVVQ